MLRILIEARSVPQANADWFRTSTRLILRVYGHLRKSCSIPAAKITVILADDFVNQVTKLLPFGGNFSAERVGGSQVAAKNLCRTPNCSEVSIVFDARAWREPLDEVTQLHLATIVAHELAHPILTQAAYASGAMAGVELPSVTPFEGYRSAGRILAEEYRADRLAEVVAGSIGSVTIDGIERPYRNWPFWSQIYIDALVTALNEAHPAWPDLVDQYRNWEVSLDDMLGRLTNSVDQTLTLIIHAQAMADAHEGVGAVLELPELRDLDAVRLCIAEPFGPYLEFVRSAAFLSSLARNRAFVTECARLGESAHADLFGRLGIRARDMPRPSVWVDVEEPIR